MYYGGFTYTECYAMPISFRIWFIKRINTEFEKSNKKQSKAVHDNNPDANALMGKFRSQTPARLRRFT